MKGAEPNMVVMVLYSKFLLTPEEKGKVMQNPQNAGWQLDVLFGFLERLVSADPSVFHKLVQMLLNEPSLEEVGKKIQG